MVAAAMVLIGGVRDALASAPTPAWVASRFCVIAPTRHYRVDKGQRNWLMACMKVCALGQ